MISILILGCNKENVWDCVQTTGDIVIQTREIGNFNSIQLEDNINLIITQDSSENLSLEGGENLLPEIVTEIEGDTLFIRNENSCNWVRRFDIPVNLYISVNKLKALYLYGYGTIETANTLIIDTLRVYGWNSASNLYLRLNAQHLALHLSTGPMALEIKGTAYSCFIYSAGFAVGDLDELTLANIHVSSLGTGDFYVNASQKLSAEIKSFGNIYYKGSPTQIDTTILGSGKLIKIN